MNDVTLHLKGSVAVWDPEEKTLTVGLFPFPVGEDEAAKAAQESIQAVAASHPSPNPAQWERSPVAAVVLTFRKRPKQIDPSRVTAFSVRVYGLTAPDETFAISRRTSDELKKTIQEIEGRMKGKTGSIRLSTGGSDAMYAGTVSWELSCETPIRTRKGR